MSKLSFYSSDWKNAQVATSEYITPEDGQYKVLIENVSYTEQDRDGNESDPSFVFTFQIMEGNQQGQRFRRFTTLRNENAFGFFKRDLQKLGIPIPDDVEELPTVTQTAIGVIMGVTVKSRFYKDKCYKDIYFDKRLGKQASPTQAMQQPQAVRPQPQTVNPPRQTVRPQPQWAQVPRGYVETPFNPDQYDDIPF